MEYLLGILTGFLVGYWAKEVISKLNSILTNLKENREYSKAGVVRPKPSKNTPTTSAVQDLTISSPTGAIKRRSPMQYMNDERIKFEERLKSGK